MALDGAITTRAAQVAQMVSVRLNAVVQIQHAAGRRWEYVAGDTRAAPVVPGQDRARGAWRIVVLSDGRLPDERIDAALADVWPVFEALSDPPENVA